MLDIFYFALHLGLRSSAYDEVCSKYQLAAEREHPLIVGSEYCNYQDTYDFFTHQ